LLCASLGLELNHGCPSLAFLTFSAVRFFRFLFELLAPSPHERPVTPSILLFGPVGAMRASLIPHLLEAFYEVRPLVFVFLVLGAFVHLSGGRDPSLHPLLPGFAGLPEAFYLFNFRGPCPRVQPPRRVMNPLGAFRKQTSFFRTSSEGFPSGTRSQELNKQGYFFQPFSGGFCGRCVPSVTSPPPLP